MALQILIHGGRGRGMGTIHCLQKVINRGWETGTTKWQVELLIWFWDSNMTSTLDFTVNPISCMLCVDD